MAGAVVVGLVATGIWFNARLDQIATDNVKLSSELEQMADQEAEVAAEVERLAEKDDEMGKDLDSVGNWGGQVDIQLAQLSNSDQVLTDRVQTVSQSSEEFMDMMSQQRFLSYMSTYVSARPTGRVNMLWGSESSREAYGMVMCCRREADGDVSALLAVYKLPQLPEDKVYQVWFIQGDQRYTGGVFSVDSTGYGLSVIVPAAPMADFDAIGITVEPAQGSGGPTGTNVLKGEF
jgi:outer membrane murein-binding lipoprotein Lpp